MCRVFRWACLVGICAALACLTGCGKAEKEIVVLGENSANINAMEQTRNSYQSKEGYKLRFEKVSFEDAETKAVQDFYNKTGTYDIVLQYNFLLSSFVRNDYVSPISELKKGVAPSRLAFERDIFPVGWKEVGYYFKPPYKKDSEFEQIGYPFALNTMLLVYNKKMFEDPAAKQAYAAHNKGKTLQPPKSWDDFLALAAFFTDKSKGDPSLRSYGVVLEGAADGWLYYEWMNFLFGQGGRTMDKQFGWMGGRDTPLSLDSPAAIAAGKYYLALKPYNAGDFFVTKPEQQIERMRSGRVAMAIMWSDYVPELIELSKPEKERSPTAGDFGFAPIPGPVSMLAGGSFFVNRHSKKKAEAFNYIVHLMQRDTQVEMAKRGLASPLDSVYDDPAVRALPYADALRASLRRGVYMNEAGPDASLVREIIEKHLQQAWKGELNIEVALKKAKAEIEASRGSVFDRFQLNTKN